MAPRPGRIHKEYRLPFADLGEQELRKHLLRVRSNLLGL
jgi:hypothetical protein